MEDEPQKHAGQQGEEKKSNTLYPLDSPGGNGGEDEGGIF